MVTIFSTIGFIGFGTVLALAPEPLNGFEKFLRVQVPGDDSPVLMHLRDAHGPARETS